MLNFRAWLKGSLFVAASLSMLGAAHATAIFSVSTALTAGDATQDGRISRNNIFSDWSSQKAFPGIVSSTGLHYQTFTLDLDALQSGYEAFGKYLQISLDSEAITTFVGAYLNSYDPNNIETNYLGDAGTSGNIFGNPLSYQVIADTGNDLVLVFNETSANAGLGQTMNILVEAFTDTQYTDLVPVTTTGVPAPGTLSLIALPLLLIGAAGRSRRRARA